MFDINADVNKDLVSLMHMSEKIKAVTGIFGMLQGEEPEYSLVRSSGEKEIRRYPALNLASISIPFEAQPEKARTSAYRALSSYHFGQNEFAEHIDLTASILHEDTKLDGGEGFVTMSFILPNKYKLNEFPCPLDPRIKLHQKRSQMVACRPFNGLTDEYKIQKYAVELREWIGQYSSYKIDSEIKVAEYSRPQTISFFRKNEVQIDIRAMA